MELLVSGRKERVGRAAMVAGFHRALGDREQKTGFDSGPIVGQIHFGFDDGKGVRAVARKKAVQSGTLPGMASRSMPNTGIKGSLDWLEESPLWAAANRAEREKAQVAMFPDGGAADDGTRHESDQT